MTDTRDQPLFDPDPDDPFTDDPASLLVDPSRAGPDLLFSIGTVTDGTENFPPELPGVLGNPDPAWNLTQWNTPAAEIFDPATPATAGTIIDPLLGASPASWRSSARGAGGVPAVASSFAVFGGANGVCYRLGAAGGILRDTFLQSTGYAPATLTFDQDLVFDVQERVA